MKAIVNLKFTPEELNILLVALAQLPYHQVHGIIDTIQTEAGTQLLEIKQNKNHVSVKEVHSN